MINEKILIEQRFSLHIEVHSQAIYTQRTYTCIVCKESFNDGHLGIRHGEDFVSEYCDTCFTVLIRPCCGSENPLMKLTKLVVKDHGINR